MKNLLIFLSFVLFVLSACKKDNSFKNSSPARLQQLQVSKISPSDVTEGMLVSISGIDLGTSANGLTVYFNDKQAIIRSVEPTKIEVIVPKTSSGEVTFKMNGTAVSTSSHLTFTYYTSTDFQNDVNLTNQADIDNFVETHKGQRLNVNGNLSIGKSNESNDIQSVTGLSGIINSVSGLISLSYLRIADAPFLNTVTAAGGLRVAICDFKSLNLSSLQKFSGDLFLSGLNKLTQLEIRSLVTVNNLEISFCPLITDITGLNTVESATSVRIGFLGVSAINMENLISVTSNGINFSFNKNLSAINFKSLNKVNGQLYVYACPQLYQLNFKALKSVSGRLMIYGSNISDLNGFGAIQSLGALNLTANPLLTTLQGLEQLNSLELPGITGVVTNGVIFGLGGLEASMGGIAIESNPKLISLSGLQNVKTLAIAKISNNPLLNDLCPLKNPILKLKSAPIFTYTEYNVPAGQYHYNRTVAALDLWGNGTYTDTEDELKVIEHCN
ncbi:IPT/TIG domain-containing protein [Mucilaginibacter sp. CAU 1740]|uniref:IPT/TIG domain-containing protein n=1 Tax=Mucilaginibacter sp. CAU 1740 TaxID=3140365 RepID=UPI00325A88C9